MGVNGTGKSDKAFSLPPAPPCCLSAMAAVARPLEAGDFGKGYLDLLAQLTTVGTIDQAAFTKRLEEIQADTHHTILVIEDQVRL